MKKKINIIDHGLSSETLDQLDQISVKGGIDEHHGESAECIAVLTPLCPPHMICSWHKPDCQANVIKQ
jgi:hypothetical protein